MPPTTRSRSQRSPFHDDEGPTRDPYRDSDSDDEASDASMEEEEDDEKMVIRSPTTNIRYDISSLDPETQAGVRQLFRESPTEETPQLVLQWCQSVQEQQDGQFYAFQMHEVVRKSRAIRIGSTQSRYRKPWCNCMGNSDKPCKHLIFLLDQLTHHTTGQRPPEEPVHLANGTEGDNNPFESISSFHLDLLASKLHSDVGSPDSRPAVNPVRLQETREILVSIAQPDMDDYSVKEYRPDIFEDPGTTFENNDIISYNDLTRTVANMLMTNNEFFAYFLKLLGPNSRAGNPFRKIQQHIDRVLSELDSYARNPSSATNAAEGPRDVPWAAAHITRAVSAIQSLLQNRPDAPSPTERATAARALVRILHTVILDWNRDVPFAQGNIIATSDSSSSSSNRPSPTTTPQPSPPPPSRQEPQEEEEEEAAATAAAAPPLVDRNLYQRLIGSQTRTSSAFVIDVLTQLPEQNQWIETLEEIEARLGEYNPPAGYMGRLRDLIALMRSSRPAGVTPAVGGPAGPGPGASRTGGKRRGGGGGNGREGGAKRAK
ncbi:hypothetical protein VMCG_01174 [Cytospora schulzeri]|uniref:SWIM-type domain-containing protein n=1 Tax=Cytospora schulzeri TaxID=448051 RepID=A0A423X5Q0_9PEZI|nr:hypothetical protein VMCG_01174 [Valsa malicola]